MAENNKNLTEEEIEEDEDIEDQNEEEESGEGDDGKSGGDKGGKQEKTFTQSQVTAMMTREKKQGRNAAYREMGIDPKDTKMVNMFKAFVDSQKTEEQKAVEKENENNTKLAEAQERALMAEVKAEAMMLGVKKNYVDDAVTLVLSKMTEDSDIKTIVGELKTKYPIWFGESGGNGDDDDKGKSKGQRGTGSTIKDKGTKRGNEQKGMGARLAAQRKTVNNKKTSYWG